jgi:hypothetical protein
MRTAVTPEKRTKGSGSMKRSRISGMAAADAREPSEIISHR